jgi:V/A-type H+-transporting ATPase subunit E
MSTNNVKTSGVQDLVNRLREDGIAEGRREAELLVEDARRKAAMIVEQAETEAAKIRADALDASKQTRKSAEEALRLAVRDSLLRLRTEVEDRFAGQLGSLITQRLQDTEFMDQLILAIAGNAVPKDRAAQIQLPATMASTDGDEGRDGVRAVDSVVRGLTGEMLREGITLSVSNDLEAALSIRVGEEGLEIHLDDRTLTELLGQHLLPRFRSLLDGVSAGAG